MAAPLWWRAICRGLQTLMWLVYSLVPRLVPHTIRGKDSVLGLPEFLRGKKLKHPLVVTDPTIMRLGLADALIKKLAEEGMSVAVYKDVAENPTLEHAEAGYQLYKQEKCDCIIGFGGGSSIDCAKLVGVRVVRPRTPIAWLRGLLPVMWPLPPLVAVPTTSGTGSEATLAAVVRRPDTQEKYALMDPALIPRYAVLDPALTVGLPKFFTAITGLDALTHGVEAYINRFHVRFAREAAVKTVSMIFENIKVAHKEPTNLVARGNMMEAAYLGGVAFSRAYVGNVHAIAHALGAFYNVPHGLANAIILPHVLTYYGSAVHSDLARLAEAIGHTEGTDAEKAAFFIKAVEQLNASLAIPTTMRGTANPLYQVREEDIPLLAAHAAREANPLYPVPVIFSRDDFAAVIRILK